MQVIIYRALATFLIALVIAIWFYPMYASIQQSVMIAVVVASILLLFMQAALRFSRVSAINQWVRMPFLPVY